MYVRLSTQQLFSQATTNMVTMQAQIDKIREQVSSGKRIMVPSDDPIGAVRQNNLRAEVAATTQYQSNVDLAINRLSFNEATLTNAGNLLQSVRELAVRANNASLSPDARIAMSAEVRQTLDSLLGLANQQDSNGEYIFSGYATKTAAVTDAGGGVYTYNGDAGQRAIKTSAGTQVTVNDPGSDLFFNIPAAAGGTQSIFSTLYQFANGLATNTLPADNLANIDAALRKNLEVRAAVGGKIKVVELQQEANGAHQLQTQQLLQNVEGIDYASAISNLNQQVLGLQAAQQSFMKVQGLSLFNYL